MKVTLRSWLLYCMLFFAAQHASGQTLVHYWNFNNSADEAALLTPASGTGSIVHLQGGTSVIQTTSNTGQGFDITNPNARNGDAAGTHLRLNNPIGAALVWTLPTTGYENIVVKYATRRSGSGAGLQKIEYSTDGINYDSLTSIVTSDVEPVLQTLDFSAITTVNDNAAFTIRVTFSQGAGGATGNNRFDNLTLEGIPAGSDVTPPAVTFAPASGDTDVLLSATPTLTFDENIRLVSDAAITAGDIAALVELRLNDAAGAPVAFTGTIAGKVITITPDQPLDAGQVYYIALNANVIEDFSNNAITDVQSATFTTVAAPTPPVVTFLDDVVYQTEGDGTVEVKIAVTTPGSTAIVNVQVLPFSTALEGEDYMVVTSSVDIPANAVDTFSITIDLPENSAFTGGRYLTLAIVTDASVVAGSIAEQVMLINDNDVKAPVAQADPLIQLRTLGSFKGNPAGGSAEISAYDPGSKRLFITNITKNTVDILDLKDPVAAVAVSSIDMAPYGGGINSVAVKNGIVAAAVQGDSTAEDGSVVFFDINGVFVNSVGVGNLPDMIVFSHDGTKVLTANEGEPNSSYTVDPLGSISVIDLTPGVAALTNANVTTLTFEGFDSQIDDLRAAGVRIFGVNATVSSDFEPEYICVSDDDKTALVTLQENNAIAVIDLVNLQITEINPLGYKDHTLPANLLDASDRGGKIFFAPWKIKGAYMPDAIECFETGGVTYAITANEGDAREYTPLTESRRLNTIALDSAAFPDARFLKKDELLGRLNITNASGDTDGDGDLDEIYAFGGRSITIWNTATGEPVWDSGSDLETITANDPVWGASFNASNGTTAAFKNRSDDKGPEPEAVVVAEIEGRHFVFAGLERIGGIVVYDVTNPAAPVFVQYINTRNLGDLGPEGLIFIPKSESPNGRNLIVLSNEISGTVTVFQVELDRTNTGEFTLETFDYQSDLPIATVNGQTIFEGGVSGLHYIPGTDREFYAIGDRGPNADATSHPNATGTTLLFPNPEYAPKRTRFKAENGAWTIQSIEPLRRPGGDPVSGLPLPVGAGNTGETAWADTTPVVLNNDIWGIDSEGIVEDNDGNLWICDEYGASVWKVNKTTLEVIKRYTPYPTQTEDAALPAAIGKRRPNRGFEGVAYTPNGKIYAFVQSPADNPTVAVGNSSRLIRLVEIDPATDSVRQFAYEVNPATGGIRTRDWKIGDLVAVNNHEFLLIEHAERNGWNDKKIFKIDIAGATPLTTEDYNGQTLEQVGTAANLAGFGVNVVSKTVVLDLLEAGWDRTHDKPEGLTILNDSTIAVVNDNDFGIASPAADGSLILTGKTTRLYIYGLPEKLGYVSPYCTYDFPVAQVGVCAGDTATLNAGAGFAAYQWSDGSAAATLQSEIAGTYTVTVTNEYGCKSKDSVSLVVNALPVVDLGIDQDICEGASVIFDAGEGFESYQWNNTDSTRQITATVAGTYAVTVTNAFGCTASGAVALAVNPLPVLDLNDVAVCPNSSAALDAGAGFAAYLWSDSSATQQIMTSVAGTYTVTVTSTLGCTTSGEITLSNLAVSSSNVDLKVCPGEQTQYAGVLLSAGDTLLLTLQNSVGCDSLVHVIVTEAPLPVFYLGDDVILNAPASYTIDAGAGFAEYFWSTGATTHSITVTASGTYAVTVVNANGCEAADTIVVNIVSGTQELLSSAKLNVYPNPTTGWVNLDLRDVPAGSYAIAVVDIAGKTVLQQPKVAVAGNIIPLDLSPVADGTYFMKVISEKGILVRKVVKVGN